MIRYIQKFFEDRGELFEMSNFWPKDTGLDYVIWVSAKSGREKHGARIKVDVDNNSIPVSIEDTPEIKAKSAKIKNFSDIQKFIILNKDVLLKYWNREISTMDLTKNLKKIKYKDRG